MILEEVGGSELPIFRIERPAVSGLSSPGFWYLRAAPLLRGAKFFFGRSFAGVIFNK
jgi:hypothetical protein